MADSHGDCGEHEYESDGWIEMERIYQEKSSEEESLVNWFTKNVDVYLPSDTADTDLAGGQFSVLSFGCGNGTKDRAILGKISLHLSQRARILYHAVDPAADEIEKFKKAVQNGNESFKKVDFAFYVNTYENYMETEFKNKNAPSKAKLILFIDSLCHFSSSTEDALVHCHDNVSADNGVIVVTLWNSQDFWFKIREIYGMNRSKKRTAEEGNDYLTIQEVYEIAQKHGWKFQLFAPEYRLDVTECFKPDSQDGKYLLDCLACFSNVEKEARLDPKKLLRFLQDKASESDGKRLLAGNHGVLIIYKQ